MNTLAELRGIKMRIPGLGAEVLSRLGVTVQTIPGGEIYPALERGVVDAAEWIGPYDDLKLGFHRVAKNYYYPGWWEPGPTLSLYVNRTAWDSLPSEYQAIVAAAAAGTNIDMTARYDAQNPGAMRTLVDEGVTLRPFSDEIMDRLPRHGLRTDERERRRRRRLPEDLRVLGRLPHVLVRLVQHRRANLRPFLVRRRLSTNDLPAHAWILDLRNVADETAANPPWPLLVTPVAAVSAQPSSGART